MMNGAIPTLGLVAAGAVLIFIECRDRHWGAAVLAAGMTLSLLVLAGLEAVS